MTKLRPRDETAVHKPRREVSEKTSPDNTLILDLQPLEP